jgi:uncharacterized protein (TIGR04562 family)
LKEGNKEDGIYYKIPNSIFMITDITDLFKMALRQKGEPEHEERLWAEIILKVMHTILHTDKDLRASYFTNIQTQILDRFYRYLIRDEHGNLWLGQPSDKLSIQLIDYQTKAKKSRDSVIIKLLHKAENVAEELFDRVGLRFVTKSKLDCLRVIKFLLSKSLIIPHNIKPSRSLNTLINLEQFQVDYRKILKNALREELSETALTRALNEVISHPGSTSPEKKNTFSSTAYKSIQFTCRHLVKYRNPLVMDLLELKKLVKELNHEDKLAVKIKELDISSINREIKFFYPYEVQIVDQDSHLQNNQGEASHQEYKRSQVISARDRIFSRLNRFKMKIA